METGISIAGSGQSMPFYYNNTGGTASETQRTFTVPQNWTLAGAKTLSIPFRGTAGNTGTLYVKINGVKVTYPRDSANLAMNGWLAFNIDLASVSTNLQSVTKLAIGVDGSGASGMILIDDITLHNTPGEIVTPTDPGTNGLVAHYTFEGNANDVSGRGNHGTVVGNAQYAAGAIGQAVSLDGATYIDCGNSADFAMTDQVTMAVWMNNPGFVNEWEAIMARGEDSYRMARNDFANVIEFGMNGPAGGWFAGTVTVDDGEWHHVACVYDSAMAYIYVDGVEDVSVARTGAFGVSTASLFIGENSGATGRQFGGMLDDVRIYNRALSAGEALWLAGGTTSIEIPF
ncbi:MAG: LamG domain-containing protein, partial [Phycisphaerae bacterium]|nr:LamG domain-containing protein [Phycisphaerae bacterium]